MRRWSRLTVLGLILPSFFGCATYRQNISDDFRDTFKAKVGVGLGLYADVKITSLFNPSVGWFGSYWNVGLENRHADLVHYELSGYPFPLGLIPIRGTPERVRSSALRMESYRGTGSGPFVGQLIDVEAISKWDAYGPEKRSPHVTTDIHELTFTERPLGIEVGAGLLFVNARLGFDPVELVDLICTAFGFDILEDNLSPSEPESIDDLGF